MRAAGSQMSVAADAAPRNGVRSRTLAYGEVRVGPAELAIGFESVPHVSPTRRRLYDQAVAVAGVDPENVLVVRITEAGIEVDAIDADDPRWPVRTLRVGGERLRQRIGLHDRQGTHVSSAW